MSENNLKGAIETLLFVAKEPLTLKELAKLTNVDIKEAHKTVTTLKDEYQNHGLQIIEIAHGYQMATRKDYAAVIERLVNSPIEITLSPASMETLAIIAYRQPVSRGDVERIRGVNSDHVVKTLQERGLIEEKGRADTLGRPILYETTDDFLKHFGLKDINDLPKTSLDKLVEKKVTGT